MSQDCCFYFLSVATYKETEIQLDAAFHSNFILFNPRYKVIVVWTPHTHTRALQLKLKPMQHFLYFSSCLLHLLFKDMHTWLRQLQKIAISARLLCAAVWKLGEPKPGLARLVRILLVHNGMRSRSHCALLECLNGDSCARASGGANEYTTLCVCEMWGLLKLGNVCVCVWGGGKLDPSICTMHHWAAIKRREMKQEYHQSN